MAGKQYGTRPGTPGQSHAPPPPAPLTTCRTMGLAGVMATPSQFVFLEQSGKLFLCCRPLNGQDETSDEDS